MEDQQLKMDSGKEEKKIYQLSFFNVTKKKKKKEKLLNNLGSGYLCFHISYSECLMTSLFRAKNYEITMNSEFCYFK